jgi:nitrogen regulatory protein P-II 1
MQSNGKNRKQKQTMKKIEAIIKPMKVEEVKDALMEIGVKGITVTEVKEAGHQKSHTEIYRGNEYTVDFHPEVKIEAVLQDAQVDAATRVFYNAIGTDKRSQSSLFIIPIENALAKTPA